MFGTKIPHISHSSLEYPIYIKYLYLPTIKVYDTIFRVVVSDHNRKLTEHLHSKPKKMFL